MSALILTIISFLPIKAYKNNKIILTANISEDPFSFYGNFT